MVSPDHFWMVNESLRMVSESLWIWIFSRNFTDKYCCCFKVTRSLFKFCVNILYNDTNFLRLQTFFQSISELDIIWFLLKLYFEYLGHEFLEELGIMGAKFFNGDVYFLLKDLLNPGLEW